MSVRELLDKKGIYYTTSGRDFLVKCTNPDHADRNPSMRVDQVLGIYQCMSCGHKGNIFFDYEEAPNKMMVLREQIRRKIEKLRSESIGLEFPEGYTPYVGNWRNISPQTYKKFEAFRSTQREFAGRIVFPIRDITGRIVVFQGRDELGNLDKKYLNWPKGTALPIYPSVEPINGSVVLVEGIFDVINLHDKGLDNAMAVFGVNTVKKNTLVNLRLQGVSEIVCMFDPDDAGNTGSSKVEEICKELDIRFRRVNLPVGLDPGDLNKGQVERLKGKLYD